jgi:hypothetical protein
VLGYGLYVNTLVYAHLRLFGEHQTADGLRAMINRDAVCSGSRDPHAHEGLTVPARPFYALYSYKIYNSDRFDLLGNSLAILTGIAERQRACELVAWVERECKLMRERGDLAVDLPPCLFPYILHQDSDWRPRYEQFNQPGEYHNGGIWPFVCGFYVAVCVAAGHLELAEEKLLALTELVRPRRHHQSDWGFNEWIKAQTGQPGGWDWQTWSAAMYLYAATCVEQRSTPFLADIRAGGSQSGRQPLF